MTFMKNSPVSLQESSSADFAQVRLIATDMDGTLTDRGQFTPALLRSLTALAEADIPYDRLIEMDQINPEFPQIDMAIVLGANDVINPAAIHERAFADGQRVERGEILFKIDARSPEAALAQATRGAGSRSERRRFSPRTRSWCAARAAMTRMRRSAIQRNTDMM